MRNGVHCTVGAVLRPSLPAGQGRHRPRPARPPGKPHLPATPQGRCPSAAGRCTPCPAPPFTHARMCARAQAAHGRHPPPTHTHLRAVGACHERVLRGVAVGHDAQPAGRVDPPAGRHAPRRAMARVGSLSHESDEAQLGKKHRKCGRRHPTLPLPLPCSPPCTPAAPSPHDGHACLPYLSPAPPPKTSSVCLLLLLLHWKLHPMGAPACCLLAAPSHRMNAPGARPARPPARLPAHPPLHLTNSPRVRPPARLPTRPLTP